MSRVFFIKKIDNNIWLYEILDNKLKLLRNKGEESVEYNNIEEFWKWFEEKIEYDKEELSFVISSNKTNFTIPKRFILAKESFREKNSNVFTNIQKEQATLITWTIPTISIVKERKKVVAKSKKNSLKDGELLNYFKNKTKEFRYEK